MCAASTESTSLLVVASPGRDRRLLIEWLRGAEGHDVTTCDPDEESVPEYDAAIVDESGLEQCGQRLLARRREADPLYLPHLLVGTDTPPQEPPGTELIDDVVSLPVRQAELSRRLGNLLRARRTALRLSNVRDQYERLVELTPETILLVRDDRIVYVNDAGVDLLGVADADDLVGEPIDGFVAPEDRATVLEALATVERDGRLREFLNVTLTTTEGLEFPAEVAGVTVTYEGEPASQLVVRDLSEKRERRQRLTLMSRAVESAAQGITVADANQPEEPLVYANEAFERLTGYDRQGVLGRNCRFLQGDGTDEETVARIRRAIDDERPVSVELLNYRADGTPFWNQLDIVPIRDDDGTVTHYLGLQQDVTERRTRQERLSVLDRVLRHNIRNRTNVIVGTAELLLDAERGRDETEDRDEAASAGGVDYEASLERIVAAGEELYEIGEQAREFQAVVADDDTELVQMDLSRVFQRIQTGTQGSFELDVPSEPVAVLAHPKLPVALSAGVELLEGDGSGARGDVMDVLIRVRRDGETVTVAVTDRGGTIPRADLEAIAAEQETAVDHSRGMELWIVRWTVLASGGETSVAFDDPPTLTITLQAADGERDSDTDEGGAAPPPPRENGRAGESSDHDRTGASDRSGDRTGAPDDRTEASDRSDDQTEASDGQAGRAEQND